MTKTIQKIVHKFDKEISSQSQMNSSIKEICGIMRRDKAKGAMMYVPELSWLLLDWIFSWCTASTHAVLGLF